LSIESLPWRGVRRSREGCKIPGFANSILDHSGTLTLKVIYFFEFYGWVQKIIPLAGRFFHVLLIEIRVTPLSMMGSGIQPRLKISRSGCAHQRVDISVCAGLQLKLNTASRPGRHLIN